MTDADRCALPAYRTAGRGRDPELYGDEDLVGELLARAKTWFVVGLSSNRARPAYGVAEFLIRQGKTVVAIHPHAEVVLGARAFTTVGEAADVFGAPDVVDCFVNSNRVGAVVDDAIAVGAGAVWMQYDVIDEYAAARARSAGIDVVMDRCPAADWPRLGPAV